MAAVSSSAHFDSFLTFEARSVHILMLQPPRHGSKLPPERSRPLQWRPPLSAFRRMQPSMSHLIPRQLVLLRNRLRGLRQPFFRRRTADVPASNNRLVLVFRPMMRELRIVGVDPTLIDLAGTRTFNALSLLRPVVHFLACHTGARVSQAGMHVCTRRAHVAGCGALGGHVLRRYGRLHVGLEGLACWCGARRECLCFELRDGVVAHELAGLVLL